MTETNEVCVLTSYNGVPQIVYLEGHYDKAQVALEESMKSLNNVLMSKVSTDKWDSFLRAYKAGMEYGSDVIPERSK